MTDRSSLLAAALDYAARGWYVFPLRVDTKAPALRADWQTIATTDPDAIRSWWAGRPHNVGIAVGPSRLFVIDLDAPKRAKDLPGAHRSATSATSATAEV